MSKHHRQMKWQMNLSWPVLYGLLAGGLKLLEYMGNPLLFLFSSLSTLLLYFCGFKYGWRACRTSALLALGLSCLVFLVRPGIFSSDASVLLKFTFVAFEFSLPVLCARLMAEKTNKNTYSKTINAIGLSCLLYVLLMIGVLEYTTEISSVLERLEQETTKFIEAAQDGQQLKVEQWVALYATFAKSMPGFLIYKTMKGQFFQFVLVVAMLGMRTQKYKLQNVFGNLKLDRMWAYMGGACFLLANFWPGVLLKFFCMNALFVIFLLYLVKGFDIVYQRLTAKKLSQVAIALILFVMYILV